MCALVSRLFLIIIHTRWLCDVYGDTLWCYHIPSLFTPVCGRVGMALSTQPGFDLQTLNVTQLPSRELKVGNLLGGARATVGMSWDTREVKQDFFWF